MTAAPDRELYELAREVSRRSYTPFSRFPVGAALRVASGEVVTGTNVDNASYPMTACAERGGVSTAIALGHTSITAVAVHAEAFSISPCGGCRQVLAEHAAPGALVTFPWRGDLVAVPIEELLPYPFELAPSR